MNQNTREAGKLHQTSNREVVSGDVWHSLRSQLPPGVLDALLEAGVAIYQVGDDDDSVEPANRGKWFVSTSSRFCDVHGNCDYAQTELEAWQQAAKIFGPHLKPPGQRNSYEAFESESPDGSVALWGVRSVLNPATPTEWRGQQVVAGILYDAMFAESTARRLAELCNHFPDSNWETHSELLVAEGLDISEPGSSADSRKLAETRETFDAGGVKIDEANKLQGVAPNHQEKRMNIQSKANQGIPMDAANTNAAAMQQIAQIAARILGVSTLETRNSDRLDFHDIPVWSIKAALEAAYLVGVTERKGDPAKAPLSGI